MANVEFTDNSIKVKEAMNEAALKWLEESAIVIHSEVKRTAAVSKKGGNRGQTKGNWKWVVDEKKMEATVGNPLENAIWEEFGTGEYAEGGKGRKGGWYIPIGEGEGQISQAVVDSYGFKVVHGKDGVDFAFTKGKRPKRTLHNAYVKKKGKIVARAKEVFGGMK